MPGLLNPREGRLVVYNNPEANNANQNQNHNQEHAPQTRQPRSLQGLLRFAVEGTSAEDAAGPSNMEVMDANRREFLEDALKSMAIDVMDVLSKQIKVFDDVSQVKVDHPVDAYVEAFDTILEYVDSIDIANDFYKIGGFAIFEPCLKSPHPKIRAGACEVLAEVCQNNTFCQTAAVDLQLLPLLLDVLDKDGDEDVSINSMLAVSCVVRGNPEVCRTFLQHQGLHVLMRTIQKKNDRLRTKCAFFLANVCCSKSEIVEVTEKMIFIGYLPVLADILAQEHQPSHEYVAALLKSMMAHSPETEAWCRDPEHNMRSILEKNFEYAKTRDECCDELQHLRYLLTTAFPDWN